MPDHSRNTTLRESDDNRVAKRNSLQNKDLDIFTSCGPGRALTWLENALGIPALRQITQ